MVAQRSAHPVLIWTVRIPKGNPIVSGHIQVRRDKPVGDDMRISGFQREHFPAREWIDVATAHAAAAAFGKPFDVRRAPAAFTAISRSDKHHLLFSIIGEGKTKFRTASQLDGLAKW